MKIELSFYEISVLSKLDNRSTGTLHFLNLKTTFECERYIEKLIINLAAIQSIGLGCCQTLVRSFKTAPFKIEKPQLD